MSHREEASGKTQDTLERLCLSAGLGTPRGPPGRAGGSVWEVTVVVKKPLSSKLLQSPLLGLEEIPDGPSLAFTSCPRSGLLTQPAAASLLQKFRKGISSAAVIVT
ncbi:hypothetical protein L3Q82_007824 [Scortum barcoo]|uniref:Uncharacterized protein n=1 Tax=Scortum barcoo TaxID=214431 RepID=A0ACB8WKJ2_9TELE|nr:hypothetical protein L3Q82_007824 [Scortum barcoo]